LASVVKHIELSNW